MNILITGASGFIGSHLTHFFHQKGFSVTGLTRYKRKLNNIDARAVENLDEISDEEIFDVIINLAGAPIDKRWSEFYKQKLINSRVNTTKSVYHLVDRLNTKPKTVISASAIGYYGAQGDKPLTEESVPHPEFTHDLCRQWEQEALNIASLGAPVCVIRLGVVLGAGRGMLKKVLPPFKMGLGGVIGSGKQYLSWVHIDDVVNAIFFLINTEQAKGIYNLTAPNPVTNAEWTAALSGTLHRPALLPMPSPAVKLLFGEMGETLLLQGQKVLPSNLMKAGFEFQYAKVNRALENILSH